MILHKNFLDDLTDFNINYVINNSLTIIET